MMDVLNSKMWKIKTNIKQIPSLGEKKEKKGGGGIRRKRPFLGESKSYKKEETCFNKQNYYI